MAEGGTVELGAIELGTDTRMRADGSIERFGGAETSAGGKTPVWTLATHAIVSREGAIAARDGAMPDCLFVEADQQRFQASLSEAAATILGREGHERHPPRGRRRLVLTSKVESIEREARDGGEAVLWNPGGASLADALVAVAPGGGTLAIAGGTRVMTALLPFTARFDLAIAHGCSISDGRPCLAGAGSIELIEEELRGAGLALTDAWWLEPGTELRAFSRARLPRASHETLARPAARS